jgi:hypothetical protein
MTEGLHESGDISRALLKLCCTSQHTREHLAMMLEVVVLLLQVGGMGMAVVEGRVVVGWPGLGLGFKGWKYSFPMSF